MSGVAPVSPMAIMRAMAAAQANPSGMLAVAETGSPAFGDLVRRYINDTSDLEHEAQSIITAYLRGEPVDLSDVMAAQAEAGLSLELLVEIRNKMVQATQTLLSMQI
jgi:flagellar hook-basal body complex protein FliE